MRMPKFFSCFRFSSYLADIPGGVSGIASWTSVKWAWKVLWLLVMGVGLAAGSAYGQGRTIEGVVKDAKSGQPLPGVSIQIQGTASGTITNDQGVFHLTLPPDHDTLIITYVGYARQVVPVGSQSALQIAMQQSAASLNELVVIGYGTQQKKDLTGSIATVNAKDFQQGVISTPDQLIQGKIPGVVITPTSGMPGAGGVIRIRGGASLNASNDPLIVIDGVPLANSGIAGSPNPLTLINPEDIESITVLKDASAAAIYGNRASNGVIIITTKKGTAGGKLSVNLNTVNSLSTKTKEVSVLSAKQLRDIINQQGTAQQKALLGNANTNWQDQIYQTAFSTDNNISFTGGIPQLPYRLSVGYLDQNGILKTGYLKRTSVDLSLTPSFFNHSLKATINLKGAYNNNRFANQAAIGDALRMDPTQPVYDPNSKFGGYFEWTDNSGNPNPQATRNPVADLMLRSDKSTVKRT
jgi:TonB-linked SusC/RagA family outer membrane protein